MAVAKTDADYRKDVLDRYGDAFLKGMDEVCEKALNDEGSVSGQEERDYFLSRKETSDEVLGFLCKLALQAPEEWYDIVSGQTLPSDAKNNFKEIGVAFDASSRLRRGRVDYYHWKLTEKLWKDKGALSEDCYYIDRHGEPGSSGGRVEKRQALSRTPAAKGAYRVVSISDTHHFHGSLGELPEGDILVHAGDLSYEESRSSCAEKFQSFMAASAEPPDAAAVGNWLQLNELPLFGALTWLQQQTGKFDHVVLVGGNHDFILEQLGAETAERLCQQFGVTYLHTDRAVQELELRSGSSVRIWGSGLSFMAGLSAERAVKSGNNAFQIGQDEAEDFMKRLEQTLPRGGLDIMVVHSPPSNGELLSKKAPDTDHLGELIKRVQPKLYVCGHSHRPVDPLKGIHAELGDGAGTTLGVNAACLGQWNQLHGYPVVVDMPANAPLSLPSVSCQQVSAVPTATVVASSTAMPRVTYPTAPMTYIAGALTAYGTAAPMTYSTAAPTIYTPGPPVRYISAPLAFSYAQMPVSNASSRAASVAGASASVSYPAGPTAFAAPAPATYQAYTSPALMTYQMPAAPIAAMPAATSVMQAAPITAAMGLQKVSSFVFYPEVVAPTMETAVPAMTMQAPAEPAVPAASAMATTMSTADKKEKKSSKKSKKLSSRKKGKSCC